MVLWKVFSLRLNQITMTFNNYLQKDIHIVAILVISTRMEQREMTVTMCFSYREVYL